MHSPMYGVQLCLHLLRSAVFLCSPEAIWCCAWGQLCVQHVMQYQPYNHIDVCLQCGSVWNIWHMHNPKSVAMSLLLSHDADAVHSARCKDSAMHSKSSTCLSLSVPIILHTGAKKTWFVMRTQMVASTTSDIAMHHTAFTFELYVPAGGRLLYAGLGSKQVLLITALLCITPTLRQAVTGLLCPIRKMKMCLVKSIWKPVSTASGGSAIEYSAHSLLHNLPLNH